MSAVRMVPLVSAPSPFEARVLAARLGAEGILWELRGVDSVYPVGDIHVLVDEADLDRARDLLLVSEIEDAFEPTPSSLPRFQRWVAALILVSMAAFAAVRIVELAIG